MIAENLKEVRENIKKAAESAGRDPEEVTLIAVSKTKPVSMIEEAYSCGQREFGENKVQELASKYEELPKDIKWHQIGHLQTNKIKYLAGKTKLIHSIDSIHLAEELQKEAKKHNTEFDILLEVNVAREESKTGFFMEDVLSACEQISKLDLVHVKGLMTVAPNTPDPENNRIYFQNLRQLFVDIQSKNIDNITMNVLSMGMTNDYQIAIQEGATMVRVGTGIFGERDYSKHDSNK